MPKRCKECNYYWPWNTSLHACPECHAIMPFKPSKREKGGGAGREKTPDGWICPYCKETGKKIWARKVCYKCYKKLNELEPVSSKSKSIYTSDNKTQSKVTIKPNPKEPKPESKWCVECGKVLIDGKCTNPKCANSTPFCEACKQFKEIYKDFLCKDCWQIAHPVCPACLQQKPEFRDGLCKQCWNAQEEYDAQVGEEPPSEPATEIDENPLENSLTLEVLENSNTKACSTCGLALKNTDNNCPECEWRYKLQSVINSLTLQQIKTLRTHLQNAIQKYQKMDNYIAHSLQEFLRNGKETETF